MEKEPKTKTSEDKPVTEYEKMVEAAVTKYNNLRAEEIQEEKKLADMKNYGVGDPAFAPLP